MPEREIAIRLKEPEIQMIEQAILDRDAESALEFLEKVVKPQMDSQLHRHQCRPPFE